MRTFDDIIPPSRRKITQEDEGPLQNNDFRRPSPPPPPPRGSPRHHFPYITLIVALLVIGASVMALIRFSSAKVEIDPITTSLAVQGEYTAGATGGMPFQLITAKRVATKSVATSGTKTVNTSASGPITIYNTQSKSQTLIANTRFANSAGLIFRIRTGVTIPAGTLDKPGTATATVHADAPGPSYNVDAGSFTIPGLAGTAQASAVYAKATAPISGGASGTVPEVDATAEQAAATALQTDLAKDLTKDIADLVSEGYVLISGATHATYRTLPATAGAASGKADVQVEGTITAVIFPSSALAKVIAATDTEYQGGDVTLGSGTSLTLTPLGSLPAFDTESFSFTLDGMALLVSSVDPMQIATAVAGKSRSEAQIALTNYPEIKRAELVLRPFWRKAFPQDPASIEVVVSSPE